MKKNPWRVAVRTVLSGLMVLIMVVLLVAGNTALPQYARMLNCVMGGFDRSVDNSNVDTTGLDLNYNQADYTAETIVEAEDALAMQLASEGLVLMKNENGALPLSADTTLSLVSVNTRDITNESGNLGGVSLLGAFQNAGVNVNTALSDFYASDACSAYGLGAGSVSYGDAEDFSINEVPLSMLQENGVLDSLNGTTPVYVLKRVAGEGRDMPRSMYQHADNPEDQAKTYLEPDTTELEVLQYLNDNFDNVVLVVNSNAALDLSFLNDMPNIRSVINMPSGIEALPGVLTGAINPSGRTVDTTSDEPLASPAAQNFGDYQYVDENGELTKYNYVSYEEGIYVGYRYYETRYEDVVMGQGNAGDWDYASDVRYPFGHGLSYTTFDWSGYDAQWDGDTCNVTLTVTNTGSMAGKDVVEVYAQSPYTDYDRENGVEKASVELVGYAKTAELAPGESETVTISFDQELLRAYDSNGAGTYIFDAGDYYVTAAADAHAAVNNILAAKGYTTADGMTAEGNAAMAAVHTVTGNVDTVTYSTDSYSGAQITNQFDDAAGDLTYLTRADWTGTFPTHDGEPGTQVSTWGGEINGEDGVAYTWTKVADADLLAQLDSFDSGNPLTESYDDEIVYGADNGLLLSDMRGVDYDSTLWDDLLDQLTEDDYYNTIGISGYGIEAIDSVNKPFTIDSDSSSGLVYGGTGRKFANAMTLAQTWNAELARDFGEMIANQGLIGGCNGWYSPAMNLHRCPFSGRNGEYYSEDPFLSGVMGSNAMTGAASKGMYTYLKHFAFNDQENHRGDRDGQYALATWLNEQSARELYLVPFEMCMKCGDVELSYVQDNGDGTYSNATKSQRAATGIMTAFNRVGATWTGGSYNLITGILRTEWAFDGIVMSDNGNTGVFMDSVQMIEAGADVKLTTEEYAARFDWDPTDPVQYHYARQALKHVLYTVVNSNAFNGTMPGSVMVDGLRLATKLQIGISVVAVLGITWFGYVIFRGFKPSKRMVAKMEKKAAKKAARKAKRDERRNNRSDAPTGGAVLQP